MGHLQQIADDAIDWQARDLEDAAERLRDASSRTVRTADALLQAAREDAIRIAKLNEQIFSKLEELDARQPSW